MGTKKLFLRDSYSTPHYSPKRTGLLQKLVLEAESSTGNLAHLTSEEPPLEQVPALCYLKEASTGSCVN